MRYLRIAGILNWTLCGVSVALGAAGIVLLTQAFASARDMLLSTQATGNGVAALTYPIVGAVIVMHRPGNCIGWIFCAAGFFNALEIFADGFASYGLTHDAQLLGAVGWMNWLQAWVWIPAFGPTITLLPLLFPGGKLLSPRWRVVAWLSVVWMVCTATSIALSATQLDSGSVSVDNPAVLPGTEGVLPVLSGFGFVLMFATWIASVASVVLRFRRAREHERQQIKWLTYTVAVFLVVYPFVFLIHLVSDDVRLVLTWISLVAYGGVPVAVGVAILRNRLYEIDRLINRTLVYGLLTVGLGATYWLSVAVLQAVLRPVTQGSELAIVGSTLAVAAVFQPLRRRIQVAVDRRFNRQQYDASLTVEAFVGRLREAVDLDSLSVELVGLIERTIQPARVSLWLKTPDRRRRNDPGTIGR